MDTVLVLNSFEVLLNFLQLRSFLQFEPIYYLPTAFYTDFNVDEGFLVPHSQYFSIHSWKTAGIPTRKASKKNFRSKGRISVSIEAIYLVRI